MKKLTTNVLAVVLSSSFVIVSAQAVQDTAKISNIEEVVVVGYGTQKKSEVTGSISQIKSSEVANLVTPSFEAQLAGRASGVQITTSSGVLGEAPRIRIRGINSISSSSFPLIVVDGIPIFTGDTGGYASNNALADINPADIESYEVLKDGAAAAIYGSRAANGVIIITTKKGKQGRTSFGYNTTFGVANVVEKFDLLKTPDFLTISNEKRSNRGLGAWAVGDEFNTDWQDAIFRSATQVDHNFNLTGGLGNGSYFASVGYMKQEGVVIANEMERFTARFNADQKVTSWLKVGVNLGATKTSYTGMNVGTGSLSGATFNVIRQLPNTPIYDANGPKGYNIATVGSNTMVGRWQNNEYIANNLPNIRYVLDNNKLESQVLRIIGGAYADVRLFPFLNFRTQASVDRSQNEGLMYWDGFHGDGRSTNGRIQNNNTTLERYNWQNILTFDKTFADDHHVVITGVNEYQKQDVRSFFGGGTDLADEFFNSNVISSSYGTPLSGGSRTDNALISWVARLNYDYNKKYFIQGSVRNDKLSKFAADQRSGTFYGASAGWTISKENFLIDSSVISDLKLRGSWGKVGNTELGNDYPYLSLYNIGKYGNLNGLGYFQMGNDLLSWETSTKTDVGLELGLFDNRFTLTADYFLNDIDNLILDVPTAPSLGIPGNLYKDNVGRSLNKGWEFAMNVIPLKTEDFEINIGANVTFMQNEVKDLYAGRDIIYDNNIIREGESINSLYGFKYWGVNPANGNAVYHLQNGSLVQSHFATGNYRVFDPNNPNDVSQVGAAPDRFLLGNVLPKFFGGLNLTLKYKNFDFNTLARFSGGNYVMNVTRREMLSQLFNNNSTEILGRWQSADNPGDGWTPRLYSASDPIVNGPNIANSRFVEKGDFIKLDNLTVGYSFNKDFLNTVGLQNLRLFAQAQNAFIFTKYKGLDPEMESSGVDYNGTPRQRVISVGLNVTF